MSLLKCLIFLKSSLINLVSLFLSLILVIIICPLLLILLLPFFLHRQMIIILAKLFKKEKLGKILTCLSAGFASEKIYENPRLTLVSGSVVEGPVDLIGLREAIREKWIQALDSRGELRYPELTMNICYWMGFPFWRRLKGEINLEEHVYFERNDGTQRTNHEMGKQLLKEQIFAPFSKDNPLWRIIILPNYLPEPAPSTNIEGGDNYSMIITVFHHTVCDAYSQFKLMEELSFNCKKNVDYIQPHDYTRLRERPLYKKIIKGLITMLKIPFDITKTTLKQVITRNNDLWRDSIITNKSGNCSKDFLTRFKWDSSSTFLLSDLSDIKLHYNVSGTAVLFAGIVGAMRSTFYNREEQEGHIPLEVCIGLALPVLTRSNKLRNNVTGVRTSFPLREEDGTKRLRKINRRLGQLKKSTLPLSNAALLNLGGGLPRWLYRRLTNFARQHELMTITNIPGPKRGLECCGYLVKDLMCLCGFAVGSLCLGVIIQSQGGQVKVGVSGDEKVLESDERAREFLQNFFKELDSLRNNFKNGEFEIESV